MAKIGLFWAILRYLGMRKEVLSHFYAIFECKNYFLRYNYSFHCFLSRFLVNFCQNWAILAKFGLFWAILGYSGKWKEVPNHLWTIYDHLWPFMNIRNLFWGITFHFIAFFSWKSRNPSSPCSLRIVILYRKWKNQKSKKIRC